ncbi:hypothetical protein DSCO28_45840 [Desulfosarcina ovata subsp. sediminis]|uniref:Uncharacterized protein n=1 Tax=Desulfosarcina ovata subsp. sediminis TaxID=885957 RepID=A0A5K7ZUZ0_9BACT|nr:hypothetical protein [Desulfosarcina ovata]BBO84018.1 hypothetical protein DSCO28_45840 [Desulfosarcina ovata subsp. sediminis]
MPIQLDLIDFVKRQQQADRSVAAPPAGSSPPTATADFGLPSDVNRAVYSAAIMRPIFELEARRFRLGDTDDTGAIWDGLDLLWIAFAILDVISELTEYQSGATRAEIMDKILPLARQQTTACGIEAVGEGLTDVLGKVFDHLVNRQNRYLPFQYTWFDGTARQYRTRRFWLIKTVYTGEGREALFTLTDEGYTAYFGLHETSALDATAIGNLRIKLLIERGNVDDAISVADGNRKQCARKALEVRNTRRQIKRNIHAVAFDQVRALAEEGVGQATTIQKEGRRLHNMVVESLTVSKNDRRHEAKLHRLAEMLEHLNSQLINLTTELQQLPDDYDYHSFKLFRRRSLGAFPPMEEVMRRLCRLGEDDAARVGTEFIARIDPPAQRPLFDPAAVIEACDRALERQNVPGDRSLPIHEIDGSPIQRFISELSERQMQRAFALVHDRLQSDSEILLSGLLEAASQRAVAKEGDDLLPVAVAMAVFQCTVERRLAARYRIRLEVLDPDRRVMVDLCAGRRYRGHELRLIHQDAIRPPEESP